VKELDELPQGLHKMPSIEKVKRWYAQSFEAFLRRAKEGVLEILGKLWSREIDEFLHEERSCEHPVPNPSLPEHMKPRANQLKSKQGRQKIPLHR
jgi:pyruvate dehydrogenase kinase 2/3/4